MRPVLLLLLVTVACEGPCTPPTTPPEEQPRTVTLGGIQVDTGADGSLTFTQSGVTLFTAQSLQQRRGSATYDMEFGMFNIVESAELTWTAGASVSSWKPDLSYVLRAGNEPLADVSVSSPEEGHVVVTLTGRNVEMTRSRITFPCDGTEHFAGLGAQSHDVDHKGFKVPLWVSEQGVGKTSDNVLPSLWQLVGRRHSTHIPMPLVITSKSTAWLLETYAYSQFDLCSEGSSGSLEVWEGTLKFHLFAAPSPLEALSRVSAFVGRPRLPAPWLFAPWNDAIFGTENVRNFATFLRDNNVPSSAIWTEDWKGGTPDGMAYRLDEDWRLDEPLYPGFTDLTAELRSKGIAMQMYFNTFIYEEADIWEEAVAGSHLIVDVNGEPWVTTGAKFTDTGFADLSRPETRTWVKTFLTDMIELGALGWMADFAEWAPVQGARVHSGEDPATAHNRYPVWWQEVNDEAIRESGKQDEMLVYYRSGHLGSQPLAQVVWAGDQRTSFQDDDGLPTVIPIGLGLAATGFFFFAHDIGGYQSATNPPSTKELFFRWTTLAALSPVMRTHHGTNPGQNWHLNSDAETLAHYRRWANFHIQLYPYWRRLAHDAVDHGTPLWIPLGLKFPAEDAAWALKDELHVGPALLIAPVVTQGATGRDVYFPTGRYVPLEGGDAITGPATVRVNSAVTELPIFIRAGGLVPMTLEPAQTLFNNVAGVPGLESTEGHRILYVGLGAAGTFTEESGATYTLTGTGTDSSALPRGMDGSVVVRGNTSVEGNGFTLSLSGHPDTRDTHVHFR